MCSSSTLPYLYTLNIIFFIFFQKTSPQAPIFASQKKTLQKKKTNKKKKKNWLQMATLGLRNVNSTFGVHKPFLKLLVSNGKKSNLCMVGFLPSRKGVHT